MRNVDVFVSIIIPVYNLENEIIKLIDTIINQSYRNFECIIINDGSTDNTLSVLKKKISHDHRFKIFTQDNRGVSAARNLGLKKAKGIYVFFVDGDDYLDEACIKQCFETITHEGFPDLFCFGIRLVSEDKKIKKQFIPYRYDTIEEMFMRNEITSASLCCKLIKRELFINNNLQIPEGIIMNEDYLTCFKLYFYAKTIVLSEKIFYNYVQNTKSCTKKRTQKHITSMEKVLDQIQAFQLENNFYNEKFINFRLLKIYSLYVTDYNLFNPQKFREMIKLNDVKQNKNFISKMEFYYFLLICKKFDLISKFICKIQPKIRKLLNY